MEQLQIYRQEIDKIDLEIINLLAKRFDVVKQVWEFKKIHNLPPLQPSRWLEVLNSRKNLWENLWINPNFIENVWEEIHKEALSLEEKV